jgi:hypothetical protein
MQKDNCNNFLKLFLLRVSKIQKDNLNIWDEDEDEDEQDVKGPLSEFVSWLQ